MLRPAAGTGGCWTPEIHSVQPTCPIRGCRGSECVQTSKESKDATSHGGNTPLPSPHSPAQPPGAVAAAAPSTRGWLALLPRGPPWRKMLTLKIHFRPKRTQFCSPKKRIPLPLCRSSSQKLRAPPPPWPRRPCERPKTLPEYPETAEIQDNALSPGKRTGEPKQTSAKS